MTSVLELRGVTKSYGPTNGGLETASFSIQRGEFVFLVGSTGSGKSTLMKLLIKEIEPTAGTIRVAGRDLSEITRKKVPFYRRNIGIVFQDFKLLPDRTVYDNVAYALQVTGQGRKEIRAKVPDILRLTGLSTKLHNLPTQLSGGEQQRVSIARAFVNHPPLLLADEPTGNLDPETSIDIMRLLYRINQTGTTVLVATHDQAMVDKMRELGADVTWEQVAAIAGDAVVGRPHLARALAASGAVPTPADAFTDDWIADGGRAFVDRYAPALAHAVGLVRAAGGVPVLAHPRSPGYEIPDEVIVALADAGLCGIEVFHFDHDQPQRVRLAQLARSLNLIMTGGSDDHGSYNPGGPVPAGDDRGLGSETTPPEEYARLLALAAAARAR